MENINVDFLNILEYVDNEEIKDKQKMVEILHKQIHEKTGLGNDFLGWVNWPFEYDKEEYERIKKSAKYIHENANALVIIGIGGSYLGAKAIIDALENEDMEIYYVGNNISSKYIKNIINKTKDKEICINVISKSGTTIEPAISFRIFRKLLEEKYGEEAKNRIFITTDRKKGALKELANEMGYETFVVPDDIGGRYSVFTSVGLLPIACSGVNIDELIKGAQNISKILENTDIDNNDCYKYAVIRNILYNKGKSVEMLVNYEPCMQYLGEWWKQLFGESEGKENKGILPVTINNTTDLHSMGQYIQQGPRNMFETIINICEDEYNIEIEKSQINDGLEFLEGKTIEYVNKKAMEGTIIAHSKEGGVPNILINVPKLNSYYLGQLIYFFEKACAISGYLLNINPFNQPGVEAYKRNMYKLLGK